MRRYVQKGLDKLALTERTSEDTTWLFGQRPVLKTDVHVAARKCSCRMPISMLYSRNKQLRQTPGAAATGKHAANLSTFPSSLRLTAS